MKTIVPDQLSPGLTDKQVECLYVLMDGNWHERGEISRLIKNYIPANISGRIIKPLEREGIVEQEERPIREGSKKLKKFVRINKDYDEHRLHLLIEYSANDLVLKYSKKKKKERADLFLKIRNESIEKLDKLEQLEEKLKQNDEAEYWNEWCREMDFEPWRALTKSHKLVYDILRPSCKKCCEIRGCPEKDCYPLKKPGISFIIASAMNPQLVSEIMQEQKDKALSMGLDKNSLHTRP
jgi:hypothetical protein